MPDPSVTDVLRLIDAVNAARRDRDPADSDAERQLDARFGTNRTLAVYGTLAPGQPNYHIVEPLGGDWSAGVVEGELHPAGWGAILGYPAFLPQNGGPAVKVNVLTSPALPAAWAMLDEFEGPEYQRVLVPVFGTDGRLRTVANLYAAAQAVPEHMMRAR